MLSRFKKTTAALLALILSFSPISYGQELTTSDGVYTPQQVEDGKNAYASDCKGCHDLKFYRDMWKVWVDKPLLGFWYTIVAEMPMDNPGSLSDTEYTNVVANILSEMGFPAGDTPLDPNNGMHKITISSP
jgi:hypothetical protein